MSDTILILKMGKSRSERELLNLDKLFRKPSIILVGGFCGFGIISSEFLIYVISYYS